LSLKPVKMIANFVFIFLLVLYDIVWITLSFLTCGEYINYILLLNSLEVLGHNLNKFNIDIQLLGVYIMAGISCSSNK
jgi:hypothetical protein